MIECEKSRELISCLIDSEISDNERIALLSHLEGCPSCRKYRALLSEITLSPSEPPEGFTASVMDAVKAAPHPKKNIRGRIIAGAAIAACIAVAVIALPQSLRMGSSAPDAETETVISTYGITEEAPAPESAEAPERAQLKESGENRAACDEAPAEYAEEESAAAELYRNLTDSVTSSPESCIEDYVNSIGMKAETAVLSEAASSEVIKSDVKSAFPDFTGVASASLTEIRELSAEVTKEYISVPEDGQVFLFGADLDASEDALYPCGVSCFLASVVCEDGVCRIAEVCDAPDGVFD